jgi:hypothetical protein
MTRSATVFNTKNRISEPPPANRPKIIVRCMGIIRAYGQNTARARFSFVVVVFFQIRL